MLETWFTKAMRAHQVETACAIRAHMAYIYRNATLAQATTAARTWNPH